MSGEGKTADSEFAQKIDVTEIAEPFRQAGVARGFFSRGRFSRALLRTGYPQEDRGEV